MESIFCTDTLNSAKCNQVCTLNDTIESRAIEIRSEELSLSDLDLTPALMKIII